MADATIVASSTALGSADALKDGNTATFWGSDASSVAYLNFDLSKPKKVEELVITADLLPARAPSKFVLSASSTGAFAGEQVVALAVTGAKAWTAGEKRPYPVAAGDAYRYFRLTMTDSQAGQGSYRLADVSLAQPDYGVLRVARHSGARRRYAPTQSDGDTTFDTDSWLLSARGRYVKDFSGNDVENFGMDGRMEGGDQPPCYPVMETAKVNIQSLDRLLGRPQGLITVGFNGDYVAGNRNDSDIYLNLLGPDVQLNVTGQSTTSGGLAQPNSLAVALSRKVGIVGGQRKSRDNLGTAKGPLNLLDMPSGRNVVSLLGPDQSPYSFKQAQDGLFDPKEFLGGLTKARLLELVPLEEVLKVVRIDLAPELVERIGFGGLGAATEEAALKQIKDFLFSTANGPSFASRLLERLKEVHDTISQPIPDPSRRSTIYVKDVYPELEGRFEAFRESVETGFAAIAGATTLAQVTDEISDIVILGRPLAAELERILRDPVPPVVKDLIKDFENAWLSLRDLVNADFIKIGRDLAGALVSTSIKSICEEIDHSGLAELLLGADPGVTCEQILADPHDALERINRSLFDRILAEPLQTMLAQLLRYQSEATAKLAWAERKITGAIFSAIVNASDSLRAELEAPVNPDTDPDNILALPARTELRNAIASASKVAMAPILAGKNNATRLEEVRAALKASQAALPDALGVVEAGVRTAVDAQKQAFKAKDSG